MAITLGYGYENLDQTLAMAKVRWDASTPAAADGTVDTVKMYMEVGDATNSAQVGIIYLSSGTTWKCRSASYVGVSSSGLNTFTGLSLACKAGDYIGLGNHALGSISGTSGASKSKTCTAYFYFTVGANMTESDVASYISLYGTGAEAASTSKKAQIMIF